MRSVVASRERSVASKVSAYATPENREENTLIDRIDS